MTTIFADAKKGVMVADSRCTADGIWYPMTKVHRVDGTLLGIAGNVKEGHAWLKWFQGGKKGARPKLEAFDSRPPVISPLRLSMGGKGTGP